MEIQYPGKQHIGCILHYSVDRHLFLHMFFLIQLHDYTLYTVVMGRAPKILNPPGGIFN